MEENNKYLCSNLVFLCVDDVDNYNPNGNNNFICGILNESHTKIRDINTGNVYDCDIETITKKVIKPNYLHMNLASHNDYYIEKPVNMYKIKVDGKTYSSFSIRNRQEDNRRYTLILENGIFSSNKLKMTILSICNFDINSKLNIDKINFLLERMQLATTKSYNNFKGIKVPTNPGKKRK